ncbi:Phage capsid family protein [Caballeronia pedi]|uniref:Phage capsid family protein n=1 Tax=Caballeronia pedi TaxID=1777141 RepID=A0A158DUJ4_9BURK|nr:phage major capsid protein [Caballeronia pedi]SAK98090.1 Phage capsid family protein [Caballeronia pedi]
MKTVTQSREMGRKNGNGGGNGDGGTNTPDVAAQVTAELKRIGEEVGAKQQEFQSRLTELEQKAARRGAGGAPGIVDTKSIASQIKGTNELAMFLKGTTPTTGKMPLELKSVVSDGTTPNITPFAQTVPGIQAPLVRRLTIESLIPSTPVTTGAVQWLRETTFTNNAAAQKKQLDTKAESDIKFESKSATIATIAHFVTASKQVLDDQNGLQAYIEQRLRYGLDLATENQLLNGDGAEGDIGGLLLPGNHTAFVGTGLGKTTPLDYLRRAKTQLQKAFFIPTALIINPTDAETIDLLRDDEGRFLVAPNSPIWGMAPVVTEAIAEGDFIVADFPNSAVIWDREDASLQLGYVNDQFIKNAITLLVERRLQMSVTRPAGIIYGEFATAG